MKALQRVAEEFESWGNRTSFLPESRDLFMLYLAFFFAPLLISQQSRGRSLPVSAFHARSDGMHTMITAHSGCEGRPDNSLEYVQYALHCGADALEVDVHPKDDGFYISHDPSDGAHPDLKDVFSDSRQRRKGQLRSQASWHRTRSPNIGASLRCGRTVDFFRLRLP